MLENNVYDSNLGVYDGVDPNIYNNTKIGQVNNNTTYMITLLILYKNDGSAPR
jgi:hypothetical protein